MGDINVNHLLFADDLALFSGSRKELQKLLDIVYDYACKWRFRFNIAKSNVVIFGASKKTQQNAGAYYRKVSCRGPSI